MNNFQPFDPDFETRVRDSFARQKLMATLGVSFVEIKPGFVSMEMPFAEEFTQQNGFIHAGVITSLADTACGYAAYTLMPSDSGVLSVEFKVNLLSPAIGEKLITRAEVIKPGRTLTVCRADVFAINSGEEKLVAVMQATMIAKKK